MKKHLLALVSATLLAAASAQAQTYVLRIPAQGLTTTVTGHAALTPLQLEFGVHDVGHNSAPQSIQVANDGTVPVTVDGIGVVEGNGHFGASNNCGFQLAPGASCRIDVAMTASRSGPVTGTLAAVVGGSTTLVDLAGAGTAAAPVATPATLAFGTVAQGHMLDRTATLTNTGPGTLRVDRAALAGNSAGFSIAADACSGAYLASGGACTVTVRFTAADALTHNASLHLQSSAEAPGDTMVVALNAAGGPDAAQASPGSLAFPGTVMGSTSSAQSVTVTNPNNVPLTFGIVSFTQAQANFVRTGGSCVNGATLAAQSSCTVTVALAPQETGSLTGTLNLPVGDTTLAVALSGTGQAGVLSLSKSAHAFGTVVAGSKGSVTLTVSNSGTATTSLAFTGLSAPYSKTAGGTCGATLAAGSNCTVIVEFAPTASGSSTATLSIAGSAGVTSKTVSLSGTGSAPELAFQNGAGAVMSSLAFPNTEVGSNSAPLTVTLKNIGDAALTFNLPPATTVAPFSVSATTCSGTLAAAASCTVSVVFSPSAVQSYSGGTYLLTTSSSMAAKTLPLTGTGTAAPTVVSIVEATYNTFVLKSDNSLWAAGWNGNGELGIGSTTHQATFRQIATGVKAVAGGNMHTAMLKTDGSLWATGTNSYGEQGMAGANTLTWRQVLAPDASQSIAQIAAGQYHTLLRKTDGSLWATGHGTSGQFGGATSSTTFKQLLPANSVVDIAAAGLKTYFRKADNSLWGAGSGTYGEWGLGSGVTDLPNFTQLATNVTSMAAGQTHTMLVKTDGTVWASGDNYYGQLGDGTTVRAYTFKQVATGMSKVYANSQASVALNASGTLYGTGNVAGSVRTTFGLFATGVSSARATYSGAVAVKADGKLYVLGTDFNGNLGGPGSTSFQPRTF